jgi:P4 family phage/plasmid primase-like protien
MLEIPQQNLELSSKNEKFLNSFPNKVFAYIPDWNDKLPIIHSENLDLKLQQQGYGIFFTVNGFHSGKRTNETLTNINAFFADIDFPHKMDRTPEAVNLYKNDLLMELYDSGFVPTGIVETKNGLHVYWILKAPINLNELNPDQQDKLRIAYRDIEEAILKRFDGDPGAKDVARVLRVPGTIHQKDPKDPFVIKLTHFAPDNTYTFSEMREEFLKQQAPVGWAVAMGENPINEEVREAIEKEYPKLERPSYKKLFSMEAGSVPDGMRNKALLVAAYAAKEAGWTFEKTAEHFKTFHGLGVREIRKTIRSAFDHAYEFGYNNEVMQAVAEGDERQKLSTITSKVLAKTTKADRDMSNFKQKQMYQSFEHVIAAKYPHLKYKYKGDFYNYKDGVYKSLATDDVRGIIFREMEIQGLFNFRSRGRVDDKIAAFKSIEGKTFQPEEENPDPNIINFKNGLLDINTYVLRPHTPDYLSTNQVPVEYNKDAQAPQWFKFIMDIMNGDVSQARLLQQIAGYSLTSETDLAKAFIFFGQGANGKSLFSRMLTKIVGRENVSSLSLTTITGQFGLYGIVGKKVNLIDEISGNYFESPAIKNLISGEKMAAEVKYRPEPVEFYPTAKLIFSVNELPKINDTTPGLYRRFIIIPFERSFLNNADIHLEAKLTTELSGILNWAIEGLKDIRKTKEFIQTEKNTEALVSFKFENSPLLDFLHTTYEPVAEGEPVKFEIPVTDLYREYRAYCFEMGYKPKAMANFSRELSHSHIEGWNIRKIPGRQIKYSGIRRINTTLGDQIVYKDQHGY